MLGGFLILLANNYALYRGGRGDSLVFI